jgi:hypothetical protein
VKRHGKARFTRVMIDSEYGFAIETDLITEFQVSPNFWSFERDLKDKISQWISSLRLPLVLFAVAVAVGSGSANKRESRQSRQTLFLNHHTHSCCVILAEQLGLNPI